GVAKSIASPPRFPTAYRAERARRSWSASAQGLCGLADGFSQHLQEFFRRSDGQLQRLQPFLQLGRVRCGFSKPAPEVLDEYGCLPQRLFLFRQALFQRLHSWRGAVTQPPAEALTRRRRGVRRRCVSFSSGQQFEDSLAQNGPLEGFLENPLAVPGLGLPRELLIH